MEIKTDFEAIRPEDDIVDFKNSMTEHQRKKLLEWFSKGIFNKDKLKMRWRA